MYEDFDEDVPYKTFKDIIQDFNYHLVDILLEGHPINLGFSFGYLKAIRVKRSKNRNQINWGETNKNRDKNGKVISYVYFHDDQYPYIKWSMRGKFKGRSFYQFKPGRGDPQGDNLSARLLRVFRDPIKRFNLPLEEDISDRFKREAKERKS